MQLEEQMQASQTPVSDDTIRQWLKQQKIRLRKIQKTRAGGSTPDRDAQFRNIANLIDTYKAAGDPVFSVDTKAKEFLGRLFRKGRSWCSQAPVAFDHDFPSWAEGVLIPHGIYDLARNRGHLFDTLERAVQLMRNATTKTGLRTTVNVMRKVYEIGRTATKEMKQFLADVVQYEHLLPKWNDSLIPQIRQ